MLGKGASGSCPVAVHEKRAARLIEIGEEYPRRLQTAPKHLTGRLDDISRALGRPHTISQPQSEVVALGHRAQFGFDKHLFCDVQTLSANARDLASFVKNGVEDEIDAAIDEGRVGRTREP